MKAVITFHSIDDSGHVLSYPQSSLESLLAGLDRLSLPVLTFDDLLSDETPRGVALSFDDGMQSILTAAMPVLRDFDVPAHLFLTTSTVGQDRRGAGGGEKVSGFEMLSWGEIETLHQSGIRIESHTHSHPDLRELNTEEIETECEAADSVIASALGRRPQYFAYPFGYRNQLARDCVSNRYKAAFSTQLASLDQRQDPFDLPRIDSYYLKGSWIRKNLDSAAAQSYLSLRGSLRSFRGTQ